MKSGELYELYGGIR